MEELDAGANRLRPQGESQDVPSQYKASLTMDHGKKGHYHITPSGFNLHTREGCDLSGSVSGQALDRFNPRTREGCDSNYIYVKVRFMVSIRVPAKGATE